MTTFQEHFTRELGQLLEETFENVHGIYLDKDTALSQTLAQVPAGLASRNVSRRGTSIAAHVWHLTFYLDLLERGLRGEEVGPVDWEETWRRTEVTPEEWAQSQQTLQDSYRRLRATLGMPETWAGKDAIGDALAILAHTAYHLGAVRQILLVVE